MSGLVYVRGRSCFTRRCAIRWRVATAMLFHSSAHFTRVLLLQVARPSGNVDHDLHPLLTA